jgi:hypothetical protein
MSATDEVLVDHAEGTTITLNRPQAPDALEQRSPFR